jgi:hypothetical protein
VSNPAPVTRQAAGSSVIRSSFASRPRIRPDSAPPTLPGPKRVSSWRAPMESRKGKSAERSFLLAARS